MTVFDELLDEPRAVEQIGNGSRLISVDLPHCFAVDEEDAAEHTVLAQVAEISSVFLSEGGTAARAVAAEHGNTRP